MPFANYKIWAKGGVVGDGVTGASYMGVSAVAKPATETYPNLIVNEIICAHLARILLLPIPPGFVVQSESDRFFASLNFNLAGESLPPVNPQKLIESDASLATGIVVFDSLVMNSDRHNKNIAFDSSNGAIEIFDHSHALLASMKEDRFNEHFSEMSDKVCIDNHCLSKFLDDWSLFESWFEKVQQIPDFYIKEAIQAAQPDHISAKAATELENFLLTRRNNLKEIFTTNISSCCPKITVPTKTGKNEEFEKESLAEHDHG